VTKDQAELQTLADKLNHLFATIYPSGRGPYTNAEVEEGIRAAGGSISEQYLYLLRNGRRDNPTYKHLEALARFFDVPVQYFFDDTFADRYAAELRLLAALRDSQVRRLALRAATVSPEALNAIAAVLEQLPETQASSPPRPQSTTSGRQPRQRSGRRRPEQPHGNEGDEP
jgi:transcriptional regulator with XRE-family HTH domain